MRVFVGHRPPGTTGGDTVMARHYAEALNRIEGVYAFAAAPADFVPDNYDAVHMFAAVSPDWGLAFAYNVRQAGIPLLITPLYWPRDARLEYYGQPGDVYAGYKQQIAATLAQANVWAGITMSEIVQCWALVPQHPALVMGCGAMPMTQTPQPPEGYVMCIGRVERHKNQVNLARACASLGFPLNVVGPVTEKDYQAEILSWGGHIVGEMDHESTMMTLAKAKVHANVSFGEIVSQATLEAALLDVPCVISTIGADPDYFGPGAHYCDPTDWRDIRDAVLGAWQQEQRHWFEPVTTWDDAARRCHEWMVSHV